MFNFLQLHQTSANSDIISEICNLVTFLILGETNNQPFILFFLHIEHYWLSSLQRLCIQSLASGYSFYILDEYLMLLCPFYTWKSHVGFLLTLWFSDYEDLNPIPSMLFEPSFSWSPSCHHHHHRHYWPQPNICLHLTVFFASSSLTPANFTPSFAPSINLHLPANRSLSRRLPAVADADSWVLTSNPSLENGDTCAAVTVCECVFVLPSFPLIIWSISNSVWAPCC